MEYFAGLDVAMKETAICVVDAEGKTIIEGKAASEPDAIADFLHPFRDKLRRVGHEAGALSPWLQRGLIERDLKVVCLETIHVRSVLKAQRNKTDKNDARGLAQMLRTGWFREVHVKSDESYRLRLLLTHRRNLKRKFLDLENAIRHSLKVFGIKLHLTGRGHFEAAVREQVAGDPLLSGLCDAMLRARAALWVEYLKLHKLLVHFSSRDPVCLRFMGIPGVGPVTALAFKTAIDDPTRFKRARIVGAHFGLTPKRYQSGDSIDRPGAISKRGDKEVRSVLYEAAKSMLTRYKGWSSLKAWGLKIAQRSGHKKAVAAVARKLAVVMYAMWRDGTSYQFSTSPATA